jgi:hypothetical protein
MRTILTSLMIVAMAFGANAQKMKLNSGSFKAMSGQPEVNVVYKFDDMMVGTGKRATKETDYVAKKVSEYNAKEPGRGDKWQKSWNADRESRFPGKFEALFNKMLKKEGIGIVSGADKAKLTLEVHTTMTEPGFSIPMIMTVPAAIDLTITLYETGSDKPLGQMHLMGAPGNAFYGAAWDTGNRIQESYAKAGKSFGKWLPRKGMK